MTATEEFIGEKIDAIYDKEKLRPVSFVWKKKDYKIVDIIKSYFDWGFPQTAPPKKEWRMRRHRNYYLVKTDDEQIFKIYLDRARGRRDWVILSRRSK